MQNGESGNSSGSVGGNARYQSGVHMVFAGPPRVFGAVYGYADKAGVVTMTNLRPENREYRVVVSDPDIPSETPVLSGSPANDYDHLINLRNPGHTIYPLYGTSEEHDLVRREGAKTMGHRDAVPGRENVRQGPAQDRLLGPPWRHPCPHSLPAACLVTPCPRVLMPIGSA